MRLLLILLMILAAVAAQRFMAGTDGGLGGEGIPSPLLVGPADLDFGEVAVGVVEQRSLIATNTSDEPLEIQHMSVPAPFTVKPASLRLEPQEAKNVTVSFLAEAPGEHREAAVTIESESLPDGKLRVPLHAVAARPPEVAVEPLSISFGDVGLGSKGRAVVTIRNRGDLALHVASLGSPFPFSVDVAEVTVEPRGLRNIEVSYSPDAAGNHQAQLQIRSDDSKRGLVTVNLVGSGVAKTPKPVIEANTRAMEFGRVSLGEGRQQVLWVRNQGSDPLHLTSLTSNAPFSTPSRGMSIAPGKAIRVAVSFTPEQEGSELVPLVIHSNDPAQPVLIVSLIGEGTRGPSSTRPGDVAPNDIASSSGGGSIGLGAEPSVPAGAADDTTSAAGEAEPGVPGVRSDMPLLGEGGYVYVGTLRTAISGGDLASWSFNADSGVLSVDGFTPPPVQFPFGQFFEFAPIDVSGAVSPTGDFAVPATLTMTSENGASMEINGVFTTGDATYETKGVQATRTGSRLDGAGDGRIVFVGVGPDGTSAEKLPIVIDIPVAQTLQTNGAIAHAQ